MIHNNNDNQCQHPDKCLKSFFTYCPHCQLFLCITHLNQHHNTMQDDLNQIINDGNNQRILIEQKMNKIKQQQIILNNIYEYEINQLNHIQQYIINICENKFDNNNTYLLISEYEKNLKQFHLKEQENNLFIFQIDQILQQKTENFVLESKDEMIIDTCTEIIQTKDDYPMVESIIDNDLSIDNHKEIHSQSFSLKSKWSINLINSTCPLSDANAFGLSTHHNIPGIPCNILKDSNTLTYGRCYYHLITYHRLKAKVAKIILNTLLSNDNKNINLTTLNLFSKWSSNKILSQSKSLFISRCPLTQKNIYGLQNQKNIILCTPRSPVYLYQHLCTFHRFKSKYALRLIGAIINNEPLTKEIFQSNEQIINNSIHSNNRTKI